MIDDVLVRDRLSAWLAGSATDRARFADMHHRFSAAPVYGLLVGGSNALAAAAYGWHLLVLVALASATMVVGIRAHARARSPEVTSAATFALLLGNQACAVLLTGGADSPLLPLVLVPVFTQAVCFRPVVSAAATALAAALVAAAAAVAVVLPPLGALSPGGRHLSSPLPWPSPVPLRLVVFVAVLVCLGLAAQHLADSDSSARGAASLDALTGLFNRGALGNHFADTRARIDVLDSGGVRAAPVGLIMVDIDHFKAVNDTHGHERGDEVLQQVARRLNGAARAQDLLYRVGGEEFVVLAPGADAVACAQIAERLRAAVSAEPVCDLRVTVSAGACSAPAARARLEVMSREADGALYAAKRAGRDRVVVAAAFPAPA